MATVAVVRGGETIGEARAFLGGRCWAAWAVKDVGGDREYRDCASRDEAVTWISEVHSSEVWDWLASHELPF